MRSNIGLDASSIEISRDAFGDCWTLEDDVRFWRRMGGAKGLARLWKDARKLTTSCTRGCGHGSDRAFMSYRLHLMTVCLMLSLVEAVPRVVYPELPHFFPRFAAQAFCEMLSRAELVAEENPDVFRNHEWTKIYPYTYRSSAGTTAR